MAFGARPRNTNFVAHLPLKKSGEGFTAWKCINVFTLGRVLIYGIMNRNAIKIGTPVKH